MSPVLVQMTVTHFYTDTCQMTGSYWYRCACLSRMRCPQEVYKHLNVLYAMSVNKYALLTPLKFSVLFVYILSFVYLPFHLRSHSDNSGSKSDGFFLPSTGTCLKLQPNLLVDVSETKCRGDVSCAILFKGLSIRDQ
jgi:hypothetical protein